jgi:hypothetical protein
VVLAGVGADLCARRGPLGCGRGVCAHGEDQFWGDRGADRVVISARGLRSIEHLGSAHGEAELAALKAAAAERLAGRARPGCGRPTRLGAVADHPSRAAHLWDALGRAYTAGHLPMMEFRF